MNYKCRRCDSENCENVDGWVRCRDCGYRWMVWDKPKEGSKQCERCRGTGKLDTDMGVKPCFVCCGTGLDVIAKSKKTIDFLANHTDKADID